MSWRLPGSAGSSSRLGSTPCTGSTTSSKGSSNSHNVKCGGWRVGGSGFVDLLLPVWLNWGEGDETGLLVEDLEGRGRKSSFTMQAEVIWRLEEFDEQDEEGDEIE